MIVLKYLYYRVYKALESRTEGAAYGAFIYIITLLLIILGAVQAILEYSSVLSFCFLEYIFIFFHPLALQLLGFVTIFLYCYFVFSSKRIDYFESLFISQRWLNAHLKLWMIIGLPLVLFIAGIFLTTYVL
jgi:Ca2+-dependent lipid-binding protein, contains C2 domain